MYDGAHEPGATGRRRTCATTSRRGAGHAHPPVRARLRGARATDRGHQLRPRILRLALVPRGRSRDRTPRSTQVDGNQAHRTRPRHRRPDPTGRRRPGPARRRLLPDGDEQTADELVAVPGADSRSLNPLDIVPNAQQPRTDFGEEDLAELVTVSASSVCSSPSWCVRSPRPSPGQRPAVRARHG